MAVKNDEEIKKSLDMLEAHTGPYDEKFAKSHAEDIHAWQTAFPERRTTSGSVRRNGSTITTII